MNAGSLDRAGAAAYLSISPRMLDALVKEGRIKPVYLGRKPLFRTAELERFLDSLAAKSA